MPADIDTAALRALAEKADNPLEDVYGAFREELGRLLSNPATVLSLLDEHDALRARVAELEGERDAAERRVVTALDQAQDWRARADAAEAQVAARDAMLRKMVAAWEALPSGHYPQAVMQQWILRDLHPVINEIRASLSGTHEEAGEAGRDAEIARLREALTPSGETKAAYIERLAEGTTTQGGL